MNQTERAIQHVIDQWHDNDPEADVLAYVDACGRGLA